MGTGFSEVNIQPYRGGVWAAPGHLHVQSVCVLVHTGWPGGKMASPTMNGPPPPSPPRWASNLRPRDEAPVHFQYAMLTMWWGTPPIPPGVYIRLSLGGTRFSPPRQGGPLHQHQRGDRAACAVASTSRGDAAHCGAGPPCTFRYAPPYSK